MHPVGPGGQRVRVVGGRRRHRVGRVRPAVIGLADRDHIAAAGRRHRQPDRQIACLRTGVDQEHGVQRVGQGGGEPLAELDDGLVVEPRVGVQPAQLAGGGVGDARMGVAEHRDVVDHVEVDPARRRHQVVAPAALDLRWVGGSSAPARGRSSRRGAPTDLGRRGVRARPARAAAAGRGVSASQPGREFGRGERAAPPGRRPAGRSTVDPPVRGERSPAAARRRRARRTPPRCPSPSARNRHRAR